MKKTILTAMLFFAFLMVGIQSASAQYVNSDTATDLLETEIAEVTGDLTKATQTPYLNNKVTLFTFVKERIENGSSIEDAIQLGVLAVPSGDAASGAFVTAKLDVKNPQVTPLHQELIDLLSE